VLSVGKISKNQKGLDLEEGAEDSVEI
jgi:hypothetical protein